MNRKLIASVAVAVACALGLGGYWLIWSVGQVNADDIAPSDSVAAANRRGVFVAAVTFPDSIIQFNGDWWRIHEAWIEHDTHTIFHPFLPDQQVRLRSYHAILSVVDTAGRPIDAAKRPDDAQVPTVIRAPQFVVRFRDSTQGDRAAFRSLYDGRNLLIVIPLGEDPQLCPPHAPRERAGQKDCLTAPTT
jgi:hypothetical protein